MDELDLGGTAEVSGGVGNGQATGTGHVSEGFDVAKAVDTLGASLGFGKEESSESAAVEPASEVKAPEVTKVEAPATAAPVAAPANLAPKTWKPEEAAVWDAIPPEAKAAIARREEDIFRGIEQHRKTAEFGSKLQAVFQPYEQIMQQMGIDPVQNTANLMQAHYILAQGSQQQKAALFTQLAQDYRIDLGELAQQQAQVPYIDPQVRELQAELQQLKSGQMTLQQARAQEVKMQSENEVNTFAADPANVYFNELADDIVQLLSTSRNMTLAEAYEKAMWANPTTRAKEVSKQATEAQSKAAKEAAQKLGEIKRSTATNLKVQPKSGAATLPLGTMDDTMAATMAAIKNRS